MSNSPVQETIDDVFIHGIKRFFRFEATGGVLLILATLLAMIVVNSPLQPYYDALLGTTLEIRIGEFELSKAILLWINDGLMALFFFHVGLELKREMLSGELSDPKAIILPVCAAIGGMVVPALVYSAINWGDAEAMKGWAIPAATDIAFALGILALLGNRVPASLKVFLMTLAIIDDLGAIIIIAVFYTSDLSPLSLWFAAATLLLLYVLNRHGVTAIPAYVLLGIVLWVSVLKSGVHAILAGVLVAMFIPYRTEPGQSNTQLERLEHDLHPAVAFAILPLFAFANTGISFDSVSFASFIHPVPAGIAMALFFGKQIGIVGSCWLAIQFGRAQLPENCRWIHIVGVAGLCGIGYTMSLFISSLAFQQGGSTIGVDDRLGILTGSLLSGLVGYLILRMASNKEENSDEQAET